MSLSCDELSLRIALCDLIERLKRCEQKCSYLEQCRHELVKEVMRLRLQNEWLSTTCSNTNPMAHHSNQLTANCSHINNSLINTNNDLKFDKSFETNGSDSDNKEERDQSWQQITVRLLHDLRRDVQNAHKQMSKEEVLIDSEFDFANKFISKSDNETKEDAIEEQQKTSHLPFDSNPTDITVEDMNGFRSALSYVKSDLNHVFQALTQQNEKLNKLKAKQLRNYFKRQLNLEHTFQSSTPLKVDPKFNHENY